MKYCPSCKETLAGDAFYKCKTRGDGLNAFCKKCQSAKQTSSYFRNKDRHRNRKLRYAFGIDLIQYNQMFANQSGSCGLCLRHQSQFHKWLSVDHNHITGKVRGLLCDDCNTSLGKFQENIQTFRNAISYLQIDISGSMACSSSMN